MNIGLTEVYCGSGIGKTTLAIGNSLRACTEGKSVIIIQFLKGKERKPLDFLEDLDYMDIKIFRFERYDMCYEQLSEKEKEEEKRNIRNGLNFARKVITTQECDFLVLDEILGLVEYDIITSQEVEDIIRQKDEEMQIIMTGRKCPEQLKNVVDRITTLETHDFSGIDKKIE